MDCSVYELTTLNIPCFAVIDSGDDEEKCWWFEAGIYHPIRTSEQDEKESGRDIHRWGALEKKRDNVG